MTKEQLKDMIEVAIKANGSQSITGSILQETLLSIVDNLAHDEATIYADVRAYGAKGDGVDKGIGNFEGDHDAINAALLAKKKVMLKDGVFIVKKPIVLRSDNELYIDSSATLKLGDGANCTLIKNEHVDIPNTGLANGVTYPPGFKRNKNIKIHGGGTIDGNAKFQNRADNPAEFGDNPAVVGTAKFPDADTRPYFGCMIKLADIDGLTVEDLTLKDARTYNLVAGGISNYRFENIQSLRSFHVVNQDGIHLHGKCHNGIINNIYGASADDFIAITTMEAQDLSIRVGDVTKLRISNIYEYGIDPASSMANPIPADQPNDFDSFGPIRLSYTDELIDDIIIENVYYNFPKKGCAVLFSNVPNPNAASSGPFNHGTGRIGTVTVRNLAGRKNMARAFGMGNYTRIENLIVENCDFRNIDNTYSSPLIWDLENFSADPNPFVNNWIGSLVFRNSTFKKGNSDVTEQGLVFLKGRVDELIFDNFLMTETADSINRIMFLARGNDFGILKIQNSKISVDSIILTYGLESFTDSNNEYSHVTPLGFAPTVRAVTEHIELAANPPSPKKGDKILKSDGVYLFSGTWNKL